MRVIGLILLVLLALSLILFAVIGIKRLIEKKKPQIKIFEPDIPLADKPHLIAKVPENENKIPDANASTNNGIEKTQKKEESL